MFNVKVEYEDGRITIYRNAEKLCMKKNKKIKKIEYKIIIKIESKTITRMLDEFKYISIYNINDK